MEKHYPLTEQIIAFYGFDLSQLTRIYSGKNHGKNHWCRCGCCGTYFEKSDKSFKSVLARLERMMRDNCKDSEEADSMKDSKEGRVNIPYGHPIENKCYCLYFLYFLRSNLREHPGDEWSPGKIFERSISGIPLRLQDDSYSYVRQR